MKYIRRGSYNSPKYAGTKPKYHIYEGSWTALCGYELSLRIRALDVLITKQDVKTKALVCSHCLQIKAEISA